jgi:hypothetical protein
VFLTKTSVSSARRLVLPPSLPLALLGSLLQSARTFDDSQLHSKIRRSQSRCPACECGLSFRCSPLDHPHHPPSHGGWNIWLQFLEAVLNSTRRHKCHRIGIFKCNPLQHYSATLHQLISSSCFFLVRSSLWLTESMEALTRAKPSWFEVRATWRVEGCGAKWRPQFPWCWGRGSGKIEHDWEQRQDN